MLRYLNTVEDIKEACRDADFLPRRARLLADGGYPARVPLIVLTRIARNRRQRSANRANLRSLRVRIEHSTGFQKIYSSISSVFRHHRPRCVHVWVSFRQKKAHNSQSFSELKKMY